MSLQTAMTDSEYASLVTKTKAIIDGLPQRSVLNEKVIDWWIKETIKREGERVLWHARRAGGIGGSEAGEFLLHAIGKSQAYQSLEDIWKSKMLLTIPQRPNIHMRRGTAMEYLARMVYLNITGHNSILNTPEIQNGFSKPHPDFPHIVGNPDEVVQTKGLRVITDFKVRSNLDMEAGVSLINGAQLHWYGILHEGAFGKLPDGYGLAELDIPNDMIDDLMANPPKDWSAIAREIAAINRPGFGMKISHFKHNPKMATFLKTLTKDFWDRHVLTGIPFEAPKAERPQTLTSEDAQTIKRAQNEFLMFKLAEYVAKMKAEAARETLSGISEKYELEKWPFEVDGLSSGFTTRFNADAAASRLIQKGVDRADLQKPSSKPDVDAMIQTLEAHGLLADTHYVSEWDTRKLKAALKEHDIPVKEFESKNFRIGLTTKKADLPVREALEEKMISHISGFMKSVAEERPEPTQATPELELDDLDDDSLSMKLA